MGRDAGLRTESGRVQTPGHVRSPVSFNHLSLPLGAVALRGGDNMLDGRPRDPDLFRDRRGPEAGLECGEDQPFLSRGHRGGPVRLIRFRTRGVRGRPLCRPARRRWTVRRIARAAGSSVARSSGRRAGIVQQRGPAGRPEGIPVYKVPVESGGRARPAPAARAFVSSSGHDRLPSSARRSHSDAPKALPASCGR